jgi:hypothetical protein
MDAMQNTIYDATTGILFGQYYNIVMNNIIDSTSTYGMRTGTKNDHLFFWGNHGNNARCTAMWSNIDTTTVFKDYKVTTGDPKFVDETNGDFRLEADSPCYGTAEDIKLGVGE